MSSPLPIPGRADSPESLVREQKEARKKFFDRCGALLKSFVLLEASST